MNTLPTLRKFLDRMKMSFFMEENIIKVKGFSNNNVCSIFRFINLNEKNDPNITNSEDFVMMFAKKIILCAPFQDYS